MQILQFIRTFKAQIPVRNPANPGRYNMCACIFLYINKIIFTIYTWVVKHTLNFRRSVGGLYYLSYLDSNMLLGRAVGGGGVFVFTKAQPLDL